MTLDCAVVTTRSGAPAIVDRITGELMHPVIGPLIEAEQLYVRPSRLEARLRHPDPEPLVLLDVGLGAASNAVAAWRLSQSLPGNARRLSIVSFDRSLDALALAVRPEHAGEFGFDGDAGIAARALLTHGRHDTARTSWRLVQADLLEALASESAEIADVVYWDPFSPRANPTLWTLDAFSRLRRLCRQGATVHTYSGATAIRSAMLLAGFAVGVGNDVGETKQNTVAAVNIEDLDLPLTPRFLERVRRSSAGLPTDAPTNALARLAELTQFHLVPP